MCFGNTWSVFIAYAPSVLFLFRADTINQFPLEIIQISQSMVCQQEDMLVTFVDATATQCLRNISSPICLTRLYLNVKFPVQNAILLIVTSHIC